MADIGGKVKVQVVPFIAGANLNQVARQMQELGTAFDKANQFEGGKQIEKAIRPLGRITGQADEFSKSMAASNARVIAFGASVAIINGVAKSFKALITTSIEVEKAFADINVVLNASTEELTKFGDGIFEVARLTSQGFKDVAEGALEFARQGLSMEESLKRIKDALILVRLTGLDATEAVQGLTAAVNTFKQEGITTADVLNKLSELDVAFAVSTEDLIKGIERSGASAGQAKVSFEELAAMIAVLQERTARGGAVIGNALKTIFARVQTQDTLEALRGIGIEVQNAEGDILPLVKILEQLSVKIQGLSDIKEAQIIEKVAGKRQRDILISLLNDLGDATGRWGDALETVGRESVIAYEKNEKLNQTLAASIQRVSVSVQDLAQQLGKLGFLEGFTEIVNAMEGIFGFLDRLLDEKKGFPILRSIISGVGKTLVNLGLPLLIAIVIKLTADLVKFGATSLKTILGLNRGAKERAKLEESFLHILLNETDIQKRLLDLEGDKTTQATLFANEILKSQRGMEKMVGLAKQLATSMYKLGGRTGPGGVFIAGEIPPSVLVDPTPSAARGYIPNAMQGEQRNIARGIGGARAGDKPVAISDFNFGRGKRGSVVAHTGEYIVENYKGSGGSAIFNRDMAERMGLPRGAKKITPSGLAAGYVPNFAKPPVTLSWLRDNEGAKLGTLKRGQGIYLQGSSKKWTAKDWDTTPEEISRAYPSSSILADKEKKRSKAAAELGSISVNAYDKIGVAAALRGDATSMESVPLSSVVNTFDKFKIAKGSELRFTNMQMGLWKKLSGNRAEMTAQLSNIIERYLFPGLIQLGKQIIPNDILGSHYGEELNSKLNDTTKYANIFPDSVQGHLFETASRVASQSLNETFKGQTRADHQAPFDFHAAGTVGPSLIRAFGFSGALLKADAKRTSDRKSAKSLISKSLRDPQIRKALMIDKIFEAKGLRKPKDRGLGFAGGYIPNFGDPSNFLPGVDYEDFVVDFLKIPKPKNKILDIPKGTVIGANRKFLPANFTEGEIKSSLNKAPQASVISKIIMAYHKEAKDAIIRQKEQKSVDLSQIVPEGFGFINPERRGYGRVRTTIGSIRNEHGPVRKLLDSLFYDPRTKKRLAGVYGKEFATNLNHVKIDQSNFPFSDGYIPSFASPLQNIRQAFPNRKELAAFADRARSGDPRFKKIFNNLGIKNIRSLRGKPIDYSRLGDRELLRAIDKGALSGNTRANYYWNLVNSIFEQNPTWSVEKVMSALRGKAGKIEFSGGYVPNFASQNLFQKGAALFLGRGRYGKAFRLKNKNIVTKMPKPDPFEDPRLTKENIVLSDYISKKLAHVFLSGGGLRFLKPIGTLKRSLERGYTATEFVQNIMGNIKTKSGKDLISTPIGYAFDAIISNATRNRFDRSALSNEGIFSRVQGYEMDVHEYNYGLNERLKEILLNMTRVEKPDRAHEIMISMLRQLNSGKAEAFLRKLSGSGKGGGEVQLFDAFHSSLDNKRLKQGADLYNIPLGGGYIPNFAKIPFVTKAVGRVATNLFPPDAYNLHYQLKRLRNIPFTELLSFVLKDKPAYLYSPKYAGDFEKEWLGETDYDIQDFAYRKMFGLKERKDVSNLIRKNPSGTYSFKRGTEQYETIAEGIKSADDYPLGKTFVPYEIHPVMQGYSMTAKKPSRTSVPRTSYYQYKDRWDFDLNPDEKIIPDDYKDLKETFTVWKSSFLNKLKSGKLNIVDAARSSVLDLPERKHHDVLFKFARHIISKITDPITFKGNYVSNRDLRIRKEFFKTMRKGGGFKSIKDTPFIGADGYIPNFVEPDALSEAVKREYSAGIPINQIRINQNGRLRNSQNPMGLAVTNTRDEPTGRIPNFADEQMEFNFDKKPITNSIRDLAGALKNFADKVRGLGKEVGGSLKGFAQKLKEVSTKEIRFTPKAAPPTGQLKPVKTWFGERQVTQERFEKIEKFSKPKEAGEDKDTGQLLTRMFALQGIAYSVSGAMSSLAEETEGSSKTMARFADGLSSTVNTLVSISYAAQALPQFFPKAEDFTGLIKGAKDNLGFVKTTAIVEKTFGKLGAAASSVGGLFGKMIPFIGPLILGFQLVNNFTRVFTGSSIIDKILNMGKGLDLTSDALTSFQEKLKGDVIDPKALQEEARKGVKLITAVLAEQRANKAAGKEDQDIDPEGVFKVKEFEKEFGIKLNKIYNADSLLQPLKKTLNETIAENTRFNYGGGFGSYSGQLKPKRQAIEQLNNLKGFQDSFLEATDLSSFDTTIATFGSDVFKQGIPKSMITEAAAKARGAYGEVLSKGVEGLAKQYLILKDSGDETKLAEFEKDAPRLLEQIANRAADAGLDPLVEMQKYLASRSTITEGDVVKRRFGDLLTKFNTSLAQIAFTASQKVGDTLAGIEDQLINPRLNDYERLILEQRRDFEKFQLDADTKFIDTQKSAFEGVLADIEKTEFFNESEVENFKDLIATFSSAETIERELVTLRNKYNLLSLDTGETLNAQVEASLEAYRLAVKQRKEEEKRFEEAQVRASLDQQTKLLYENRLETLKQEGDVYKQTIDFSRKLNDLRRTNKFEVKIAGLQEQLANPDIGVNMRKSLELQLKELEISFDYKKSQEGIREELRNNLASLFEKSIENNLERLINSGKSFISKMQDGRIIETQNRFDTLTDTEKQEELNRKTEEYNKLLDKFFNTHKGGKFALQDVIELFKQLGIPQEEINERAKQFVEHAELSAKYAEKQRKAKLAEVKLWKEEENLRAKGIAGQLDIGFNRFTKQSRDDAEQFYEIIGQEAPQAFSDGMVNAFSEAMSGAKSLKDALRDAAIEFLKIIQKRNLENIADNLFGSIGKGEGGGSFFSWIGGLFKGKAAGGLVTGGSGVRDDVPHMLTGGEYVIRKSAVQKYGEDFLEQLNRGNAQQMGFGGISETVKGVLGGGRPDLVWKGMEAQWGDYMHQISKIGPQQESQGRPSFSGVSMSTDMDDEIPRMGKGGIAKGILEILKARKGVVSVGLQRRKEDELPKMGMGGLWGKVFFGIGNAMVKKGAWSQNPFMGYAGAGIKSAKGAAGAVSVGLMRRKDDELPKMAAGGFFVPGFRGQGEIRGLEDLKAFAEQRVTSGATDVIYGSGNTAGINLEPQSRRLTQFGLRRGSPMQLYTADAQAEALRLVEAKLEHEKGEKEKDKQFWRELIATAVSSAVSYGASKFGNYIQQQRQVSATSSAGSTGSAMYQSMGNAGSQLAQQFPDLDQYNSYFQTPPTKRNAKGGKIGNRSTALLMGGEYIVPPKTVAKYGKEFFDDINNMSVPRFAMGGSTGSSAMASESRSGGSKGDVNIQININRDGSSQTQTQGNAEQQDMDMAKQIEAQVVRIIEKEKRIGGALSARSRG